MDGHILGLFLFRVTLTVTAWLHLRFSRVFAIQFARMAEQHALTITSGGDVTTTTSSDKH